MYVGRGKCDFKFMLKISNFFIIFNFIKVVDDVNILQRIFPRACATAEKLWSPATVSNVDVAMKRLEEHYCRLRLRNIPAQPPNGPGFCLE